MYHVLENNRAPCGGEVIPPDPNAPELPPPLEHDSQDNDAPPVYQDITEISCKPNKLIDCDKSEQQCQHGEHLLNTDDDTVTLTDEKVQFFKKHKGPIVHVLNVYIDMFLCACIHVCCACV